MLRRHVTGTKELQTRITHNDGGSWKRLNPSPKHDSHGQDLRLSEHGALVHCRFEFSHGDGMLMSVGMADLRASRSRIQRAVGPPCDLQRPIGRRADHGSGQPSARNLRRNLTYKESDTSLSRDAGFTWEQVQFTNHKEAPVGVWRLGLNPRHGER
jgi:hypothetical protein